MKIGTEVTQSKTEWKLSSDQLLCAKNAVSYLSMIFFGTLARVGNGKKVAEKVLVSFLTISGDEGGKKAKKKNRVLTQ